MAPYSETALQILKSKGFRITKARKLVIDLLDQSQIALSAYEIKHRLDTTGEHVDTVSIYRILECLEENHLIHRVLSSGKVKKCQLEEEAHCHLTQEHHCHHLLICESCGAVQEIHCPEAFQALHQLAAQADFHITGHHLEFTGLCGQCASQKSSS